MPCILVQIYWRFGEPAAFIFREKERNSFIYAAGFVNIARPLIIQGVATESDDLQIVVLINCVEHKKHTQKITEYQQ
jgi:hypothetical protein